jgi:peroxiredoxin
MSAKPLLTMMLAGLLALAGSVAAAPKVGEPAPAFAGVDTAGNSHALSDFLGKIVVLEWTNHDCPYVRKHYNAGNMQAQQRDATAQGVVWLSVISSAPGKQGHVSAAQADELTASRDAAPTAVLLDEGGNIGRAYDARTTPHMYVIDPEGKLVYMGGIDSIASASPDDIEKATQYVPQVLAQLAAGEPVSTPVTRPYGCSVKY